MFPLEFPYEILASRATPGEWVLDPFCGRGTTNYASRLLCLSSLGVDSSPVAVAVSRAKLANTTPTEILGAARAILDEVGEDCERPTGDFWEWAFDAQVLSVLCRLRTGLLYDCRSDARTALRALLLGALHGPQPKSRPWYLSNQAQRTYAPKPGYAVRFWKQRNMKPPRVDVLSLLIERAERYYGAERTQGSGSIVQGDSRDAAVLKRLAGPRRISWVITSPPYYGMRTYLQDQWLRLWFLGGPSDVDYAIGEGQMSHAGPAVFAEQLRRVWRNVGAICRPEAHLVVRFGAINDRKVDACALLQESLAESGWIIVAVEAAGSAATGRRQALHFKGSKIRALEECDIWALWGGAMNSR